MIKFILKDSICGQLNCKNGGQEIVDPIKGTKY
jgi:hypothetical protein